MSEKRKITRSCSANLKTRDLYANVCKKVEVRYLKDKKE